VTRRILSAVLLLAAPILAADDAVFRAMRDELARSMRKLQLENLQKPYFIAYRIVESDSCTAMASFGALVTSACPGAGSAQGRTRTLSVEVRVGDYARDNTNFYAFQLQTAGVIRFQAAGGVSIPIDDNYDEIRRQLWLATDSGYKQAPDFSKEPVVTDTEDAPRIELNQAEAESMAKALSALFRQAPGIDNSQVRVTAANMLTRYVNSEGTSFSRQSPSISVVANADTQAEDGMPLADFEAIYARTIRELPPREEIAKRIGALETRLQNLRKAALVERYTGPVLFEGEAAAELMVQGFAPAFIGVPRLVVDDVRFEKIFASDDGSLIDKMGGRVLPDFLSLSDNPAAREFQSKPVFGGYQVDEDGVKAQPTVLVEKGTLKTLLRTRSLIAGTTHSTASRRGPGPLPSNLVFTADKMLPPEQLKAELMRLVKQRGKEYGILVRRINNPSLAQSLGRSRTVIITNRGSGAVDVDPLIEAYKIYPDGREELVRNLNILGLSLSAFKDIVAAGDAPFVYTAPIRLRRVSPVVGGLFFNGALNLVSVAVPSLLFDELTLQRPTGEVPNLPFTKHPFFEH